MKMLGNRPSVFAEKCAREAEQSGRRCSQLSETGFESVASEEGRRRGMAFCGSCGAALAEGSAYCGACGHSAQASSAGASAVANPASGGTGLTMNLAAALTYILGAITGMLFLVIEPYKSNRLVRFHAMQSIFFCVVCIAFAILWNILWGILASVLGFWVLTIDLPLRLLIALAIFGYWLYVMFQAYSQREYRIPWIGNFAAKQVG